MNLPDVLRHPLNADVTSLKGPSRVVIDASGTPSLLGTLGGYEETRTASHYTLVPATRQILQHVPLKRSPIIRRTNTVAANRVGTVAWITVAKETGTPLSSEESKWVGEFVAKVAAKVKAPLEVLPFPNSATPDKRGAAMSPTKWAKFSGICAAMSVPGMERFGPGEFDEEAFLDGLTTDPKPKKAPAKKPAAKKAPAKKAEPVEEEFEESAEESTEEG